MLRHMHDYSYICHAVEKGGMEVSMKGAQICSMYLPCDLWTYTHKSSGQLCVVSKTGRHVTGFVI